MSSQHDILFFGPDAGTRPPSRVIAPKGACDSHAHIVGPHQQYALSGRKGVVPPEALLRDYLTMLGVLGVERCVMVQPSAYGVDNTLLLDAIASMPNRMRGIAIVDYDKTNKSELDELRKKGVRGLRFNTRGSSPTSAGASAPLSVDTVLKLGPLLAETGLHAQFLMLIDKFIDIDQAFRDFPVDVVIDHMGYVDPRKGINSPGFQTLLRWLDSGRCWVKLSAPYRFSRQDIPYADIAPFARKLVEVAPERVLWATDWPHSAAFPPNQDPRRTMPNDGELLDMLADYAPSAATQKSILAHNPARLYGFSE